MHKSTSVSSGSGTDPLQVDRIPPQVSYWAEINVFSACKVPLGSNFIGKWVRGDMFSRSKRNRMGVPHIAQFTERARARWSDKLPPLGMLLLG